MYSENYAQIFYFQKYFYILNLVVPSMFLSALSLVVFWISPEVGDKIMYSITVFLSFTVFMVQVADIMPTASKNTPLLEMYIFLSMSLSTLYVVLSMVILHMYYQDSSRPIPRWLVKCLFPKSNAQVAEEPPVHQVSPDKQITKHAKTLQTESIETGETTKTSDPNSPPWVIELLQLQRSILKVQKGVLFELKREKRRKIEQPSLSWQEAAIRLDRVFFWISAFVVFGITLAAIVGVAM